MIIKVFRREKIFFYTKIIGTVLIILLVLLTIKHYFHSQHNSGTETEVFAYDDFVEFENALQADFSNELEFDDNSNFEIFIDEEMEDFIPVLSNIHRINSIKDLEKYLYSIDETAYADEELLDIDKLLNIEVKADLKGKEPKVLIFHTHSQEDFIDSRKDVIEDTIVGIGSVLADILAQEYGISVVHDFGQYDVVNGKTIRGGSYERMDPVIKKILKKYPSIEVVIDLHRDAVDENRQMTTTMYGVPMAKLMLFNGISCASDAGQGKVLEDFPNPYLNENLAFSLKMQLKANELYPQLMRKIYIKPYRYSLHLAPKTLLVEAGASINTVEEVKNSMKPLAEILWETLKQ